MGRGSLMIKDTHQKHLQGPLTWGGALSPLSPTANNAYLGQGEGRRAGQIQIQVILKPKSAVGRGGRRGQGGGCCGGPRVKRGWEIR